MHDVEQGLPDGPFDVAYAFDVVEHVPDPVAFLRGLEQRSRLVVVNLLEPSPDDPHVHHALPVDDLVHRARARGLVRHRLYHGRSHLLVYRGDLGDPVPGWRSAAEERLGPRVGERLPAVRAVPGLGTFRRVRAFFASGPG